MEWRRGGKYTRAEGMEGSIVNWIGVSGPDGDGVDMKGVEPRRTVKNKVK